MLKHYLFLVAVISIFLFLIYGCSFASSAYLPVEGPCHLVFPKDHGAHTGYRTEWWYFTGNLISEKGNRFGFELTFFRRQIVPPGEADKRTSSSSDWRSEQLYFAHAALTDVEGKRFLYSERTARGVLGISGAIQKDSLTRIFVKSWFAEIKDQRHTLYADTDNFNLSISLESLKPPTLHGENGYSRKGASSTEASCYYSLTRLVAEGFIKVGEESIPVKGIAWMDHEFSSAPLGPDIAGWDWFSIQFSDNTELMIYLMRLKDGSYNMQSSGTYVASGTIGLQISPIFQQKIN